MLNVDSIASTLSGVWSLVQYGYITATLRKMRRNGCFHVYDKTLIALISSEGNFTLVAQFSWGSLAGSSGSCFMWLALYLLLTDLCLTFPLQF